MLVLSQADSFPVMLALAALAGKPTGSFTARQAARASADLVTAENRITAYSA